MTEGRTPPSPNLQALGDSYDILGELRMGELSQMYIAERRDDGTDVVISVVRAPKGDENNALSHFAADTQLLSKLHHPQIPQVVEGRWVGKDEFAIVAERRTSTTLGEQLARGEKFTPPRIAAILHDVSAILEWARNNGVVHRGVTPDTLAFEAITNRVLVSFAPTPIPIEGVPDSAADARTIGQLAWAMLTGEPRADERPLAEVRPDLATRVTQETEALVRAKPGSNPDVETFIAVVAAADALRAGEREIAEMEAAILEARRAELAAFEAEQRAAAERNAELEAQLASEREEFERRMAEEEAELASVRSDFEALKAHEQSQIVAERTQLDEERREFADRAAELEARQAEVDARATELAKLRAEEGKRIDAAIAAAVAQVAARAAAIEAQAADSEPWAQVTVGAPSPDWVAETVRRHSVGVGAGVETDDGVPSPTRRATWMIPVGAAGLLVIAGLALGLTHRGYGNTDVVKVGGSTIVATPPATDVPQRNLPRGGFLTQTAAGTVAPAAGAPAPAGSSTTSATPVTPTTPVTPAAGATTATPGAPTPTNATSPTAAPRISTTDSMRPRDGATTAMRSTSAPASAADRAVRPRGAFSAEEEAIARADSIRRDSLARRRGSAAARRDSVRVPPDTLR